MHAIVHAPGIKPARSGNAAPVDAFPDAGDMIADVLTEIY
jgi:hypothetical protein